MHMMLFSFTLVETKNSILSPRGAHGLGFMAKPRAAMSKSRTKNHEKFAKITLI